VKWRTLLTWSYEWEKEIDSPGRVIEISKGKGKGIEIDKVRGKPSGCDVSRNWLLFVSIFLLCQLF
jgi:hypothetical protein